MSLSKTLTHTVHTHTHTHTQYQVKFTSIGLSSCVFSFNEEDSHLYQEDW